MAETIGAVVAFAAAIGISPLTLVATILVLFSRRASANGPSYLAGWLVGLTVLTGGLLLVAGVIGLGDSDEKGTVGGWIRLLAGIALAVLAAKTWLGRPQPGEPPSTPRLLAGVHDLEPAGAFRFGALLAFNPKNIALAVGAVVTIRNGEPTIAEAVAAVTAFVLIGSILVIAAVVYHQVGGERANRRLASAKGWLERNNATVMTGLLGVFAVLLIGQGLAVVT